MGLRILHTADWHLDSAFAAFPPKEREALRRCQRKLPAITAEICRRENCDLVLIAGDILDSPHCTRETLDALRRGLSLCGVPVLISPGNHDYCTPGSPWETEVWPENVKIFHGGMEALDLPGLDCRIYGAGYQSMDCLPLLEQFRAEGSARYCIGLLHGDPTHPQSPCCGITAAQVRESGLDYLALGHIHTAGSFRAGNTLCAWPGCPMGRGWDETGDKGFTLVTLDDSVEIRQIPSGMPRFYDVTLDIQGDAAAALEALLPPIPSEDYYRITLTGIGEANIPALTERFSRLAHLKLTDHTEAPVDLWEDIGSDTLRGVFFRSLYDGMNADTETADRYLRAAEIARRILDGKEVPLP